MGKFCTHQGGRICTQAAWMQNFPARLDAFFACRAECGNCTQARVNPLPPGQDAGSARRPGGKIRTPARRQFLHSGEWRTARSGDADKCASPLSAGLARPWTGHILSRFFPASPCVPSIWPARAPARWSPPGRQRSANLPAAGSRCQRHRAGRARTG